MKIDHFEVINLRFEYPGEAGFVSAGGVTSARLTSLILVHTNTGQVGLGSAYSHPGLVYQIVMGQLEPLLRGADPREIESLWDQMYRWTRWYGRKGAAMSALGGLDMAFWDLRGKALGKPVWSLLGGVRETCPVYASALLWKEPHELAEEAAAHIANGFRRVKMRLGRSEEYDAAAVQAVRRAIGDKNDLMVDASMRYNLPLARRMGKVLEENRVFWFEEPFEPEEVETYAALRGTVNVPLAAGENEFGTQGFRELVRAKALDILQPDACRAGGISEVWRVAKMAAAEGLKVATHTWSDAVAVVANAHAISSQPNGITVEMDQTGNPLIDGLLVEPLSVRDGQLQLSRRPGLGIELSRTLVDRLRLKDPLSVPDGFYSDMVFGRQWYRPAPPYVESRPGVA